MIAKHFLQEMCHIRYKLHLPSNNRYASAQFNLLNARKQILNLLAVQLFTSLAVVKAFCRWQNRFSITGLPSEWQGTIMFSCLSNPLYYICITSSNQWGWMCHNWLHHSNWCSITKSKFLSCCMTLEQKYNFAALKAEEIGSKLLKMLKTFITQGSFGK